MQNTKEKSLLGDTFAEEEGKKTMKHNGDEDEDEDQEGVHAVTQKVPLQTNIDRSSMETKSKYSSSIPRNQEDLLIKSVKAKMGEAREENERLKVLLAQMLKDYKSLQKNLFNVVQQDETKKSTDASSLNGESEEPELTSLILGRGSSEEPKKDEKKNGKEGRDLNNGGLSLGLEYCRFELNSTEPAEKKITSTGNSFEELKEEEPAETWPPPSKDLKTMRTNGDEEVMEQTTLLKKARVSVRARCDTPTMNDGCQWRKYGQKIAKGNPCPRAYYRCTVSSNCPVRKQVQRCVEDMSILTTTYEGTHNHPLPISATAMASTTSAAASMLQCRSLASQGGPAGVLDTSVSAPIHSTFTAANLLHGMDFTNNLSAGIARPHQFYFSNPSISTSNSHPTVTLDLTAPTNNSSQFNRLPTTAPIYSTSCLSFSSPSSTNSLQPYSSWNHIGISNPGQVPSYMQMNSLAPPPQVQYSLTDQSTIAATTKVITSNPSFQSALAAAISSYISNGGREVDPQNKIGSGDNTDLNLKWPGSQY